MASLNTLVYHVCEKTSGLIVHVPDVVAVYQQILTCNNGKYENVLLLPEYNGHDCWPEEQAWIGANFAGIPIMLDVAGGWEHHLSIEEITAAMAVADVRWLRFSELISWYIEQELPFPDEYVAEVLAFCRANDLKLYWCEWKIDYQDSVRTFNKIAELIAGYEDIVTVGFKTNSGDLEPAPGFKYVLDKGFEHCGATVESWYWETRHRTGVWEPSSGLENPDNMPVSWMARHAQECRGLGAELIQFEPYWYFFEHTTGKARESLRLMHSYLNSQVPSMEASTIILQLLQAEWLNGPAKADISWLDGRASTVVGWDIQPSKYDFNKLVKKYAVSCYSRGSSSPSTRAWLKVEVVTVDILVKTLGTTLEKAAFIRKSMQVEVERILRMYSAVGPLWDVNPGPTGAPRRRRVPGLNDVVILQEGNPVEDSNVSQVSIQVRCKFFPNLSGVTTT